MDKLQRVTLAGSQISKLVYRANKGNKNHPRGKTSQLVQGLARQMVRSSFSGDSSILAGWRIALICEPS